ncbi:hypothetical protein [Streptomyces sp. YGL11-2]|uniref:hypothetical protein n=1 Tax=Streptomyces sp. YGL11-2 TaxID=3414028 RepID=UPI003CF6AA5F
MPTPMNAPSPVGSHHSHHPTAPSPLLPPHEAAAYGPFPSPPPHTAAELDALISLLTATPHTSTPTPHRSTPPAPATVTVGHSRDAASHSAAAAFTEAWRTTGRTVLALVDWPEQAASWLRPAHRFTAGQPDAWVVAAAPLGWVRMSRRLHHSTDWDPARTFGFASLGDSRLAALAGTATLEGMRGATADGGTWAIARGWVTATTRHETPPVHEAPPRK